MRASVLVLPSRSESRGGTREVRARVGPSLARAWTSAVPRMGDLPELGRGDCGELLEAEGAFVWRTHGRQRVGLVGRVGREVLDADGAGALDRCELALVDLTLAEAE